MTRRGIRKQLLLLALGPSAALLSLLFGYFAYNEVGQLREAMLERGVIMARYLSAAAEFGVATGNLQQLHTMTSTILDDEVIAVRIYDMEDHLLMMDGEEGARPGRRNVTQEVAVACGEEQGMMLFCAPINITPLVISDFREQPAREKVRIGRLEVVLSTSRLQQQRQAMAVRSAALALGLVLFGLFLARRIELHITRPLVDLTETVEGVERGELERRVAEDADGELLSLQQGINSMIGALREYRRNMDSKVEEATARLRQAMQTLEEKNRDLEVQRKRAEEASMAKSQFLASMSHEIRTPLSGMIGMLSLLENERDTERRGEYVQHMLEAASALRVLIDEILDFSRIEAGKLTIMRQPFSPAGIIDDVAVMLAPSAHYKELELIIDIDPAMPEKVLGDPLRFRQVLINLLGNAIKFTNVGYVLLHAAPQGEVVDKRAEFIFEVVDTGIGIHEAQQPQVFESFTQLDSGTTKRYSGSGLGTTVSRDLVHLMGGEIGLDSKPGEGSRFWFTMHWEIVEAPRPPRKTRFEAQRVALLEPHAQSRRTLVTMLERLGARVSAVDNEAALLQAIGAEHFDDIILCENSSGFRYRALARELRRRDSASRLCHVSFVNGESDKALFDAAISKPLTLGRVFAYLQEHDPGASEASLEEIGPFTILLAEDNAINTKVITYLLQQAGHRVVHVESGARALEAMQGGGIDAVLMDIRMPGMDGITATRLRREEELATGEHLPIIALTANDSKEDRRVCLAAGMDDFLVKPVDAGQLAKILRRYCGDL